MTMTLSNSNTIQLIAQYLSPADIKNVSFVNHELYDSITNPALAEQIWRPHAPFFPMSMLICERPADIIQRGTDYFAIAIEFVTLNNRCIARLSEHQIMPESLVKAPMSGQVATVCVQESDPVEIGADLFKIDAMKLEVLVKAHIANTIYRIFVTQGSIIEKESLLALLNH